MNIEFKEIPKANEGGKDQDIFELFACDFLESLGYEISERPSRGPDGKKDLIVTSKPNIGITSGSKIKWLVSCKHFAHSENGVSDTHEPDILDRVRKHQCHGFLGFYSTIPNSSLIDKLKSFENQFPNNLYDHSRIEKEIYSLKDRERILATYFPESKEKWERERHLSETIATESSVQEDLPIAKYLEISRTALIQVEILKIKYAYSNDWDKNESLLNELTMFVEHKNETIAEDIFNFIRHYVSVSARSGMPSNLASTINSLVLTYFPSSFGNDSLEKRIENGKLCIYIAYDLAYDAFIHANNFGIAQWGLHILKFIYREGKRHNYIELTEKVLEEYERLINTLNRPERTDLRNAKEFVQLYKNDLEDPSLGFPVLPLHLYKLTLTD